MEISNPKGLSGENKQKSAEEIAKSEERIKKAREMFRKQFVAYYTCVPNKFDKEINVVMQKDGLFEVRFNEVGTFVKKVNKVVMGEDILHEGFRCGLPRKIPLNILKYTIDVFKLINDKYKSEFYLQYYWDRENGEYLVHFPIQSASGGSVSYIRDKEMEQKYLLVMDIHSHNTMGAFWSGVDDADEKETRMFGVIGKINNDVPEMKFRVTCGGEHLDVFASDFFDLDNVDNSTKELAENIKSGKHIPTNYGSYWNCGVYHGNGSGISCNGGYVRNMENDKVNNDDSDVYGKWWKNRSGGHIFYNDDDGDDDDKKVNECIAATAKEDNCVSGERTTVEIETPDKDKVFADLWSLSEDDIGYVMKKMIKLGNYNILMDIIERANIEIDKEDFDAIVNENSVPRNQEKEERNSGFKLVPVEVHNDND